MSVDFAAHIAAEVAHTRKLAAIPGWRPYIEKKASGMAKKYPGLYAHLPQVVAETPLEEPAPQGEEPC
jgi:hypothetical protein